MSQYSILFVDDEPNVTAALKRAFRREPYEVLSANTAQEGLDILSKREIDVVVSDEQMPEMSGSEFLTVVCEKHPQTIRMILTGQASLSAAIRAINEGEVYRFFTKPCNEIDLKSTIRSALQQRELELQARRLLQSHRKQSAALEELERVNPGITAVEVDGEGAIVLDLEGDTEELLKELAREVGARR